MSDTTRRVVAASICVEGRFLTGRRPLHKCHGGLWEFPGGKCQNGESDAEAVARELREELDVKVIDVGTPLMEINDEGSGFVIAFLPVQIEGTPRCIEHLELTWSLPSELKALPLAPSDLRFVEFLLRSK
jgi:8-oxo-dGTP pyrophosphatase MutT (NUDIX family)